ncbi:MAG TPA: DUF1573 domain-containing protein [Flavobacterium sp.]|nr:DUF1573 domain-containing protein [Flavobacterium sp.]
MKKLMIIAGFSALSLMACNKKEDASSRIKDGAATETTSTGELAESATQTGFPKIAFNETVHDFGDVKKGSRNEVEFEIRNEGAVDLVIINASAACGCTVPEKPEAPIKPGESAKMKVVFSATGAGLQSKNVTLTTNTEEGSEILTVKANVIE